MLKLENVYKRFGSQLAVNDLSFELNAGEIVGLLGPNGAGKTTTMRLIASYFFPDVGKIYVAGHNTVTRTLLTQADIGYLPENNPLYPDMLVVDFLLLTWGLSDGQQKQRLNHSAQLQRIHCVAQSVNLDHKLMQTIGSLSKGYKQRVGLAAAMLTEPKILILDEPTEGLDPNERAEIRTLIQKLSVGRIILISTHVLQEVKAICTKAIVISDGKLVVAGDPEHLSNKFTVVVDLEGEKIDSELKKLIKKTKSGDYYEITNKKSKIKTVTITSHQEIRPNLAKLVAKNKWIVWSLSAADELDQVFRSLK